MTRRSSSAAPVGVVVIGAGAMGRFQAETIADLKQAGLIALVDPVQKDATAAARQPGGHSFAEADDALALLASRLR